MKLGKSSPAEALIASKRHDAFSPLPPLDGWEDALRTLIDHNDAAGCNRSKVSALAAIKMLREHYGWAGNGRTALDSLCVRALGRHSYGTP